MKKIDAKKNNFGQNDSFMILAFFFSVCFLNRDFACA